MKCRKDRYFVTARHNFQTAQVNKTDCQKMRESIEAIITIILSNIHTENETITLGANVEDDNVNLEDDFLVLGHIS